MHHGLRTCRLSSSLGSELDAEQLCGPRRRTSSAIQGFRLSFGLRWLWCRSASACSWWFGGREACETSNRTIHQILQVLLNLLDRLVRLRQPLFGPAESSVCVGMNRSVLTDSFSEHSTRRKRFVRLTLATFVASVLVAQAPWDFSKQIACRLPQRQPSGPSGPSWT